MVTSLQISPQMCCVILFAADKAHGVEILCGNYLVLTSAHRQKGDCACVLRTEQYLWPQQLYMVILHAQSYDVLK